MDASWQLGANIDAEEKDEEVIVRARDILGTGDWLGAISLLQTSAQLLPNDFTIHLLLVFISIVHEQRFLIRFCTF